MGETEQTAKYVQTIPLKAQRDELFDSCETTQDRQRWFAKVGKKGYMVEDFSNRMYLRLIVESSRRTAQEN